MASGNPLEAPGDQESRTMPEGWQVYHDIAEEQIHLCL
jgi:hypothetical protein